LGPRIDVHLPLPVYLLALWVSNSEGIYDGLY